MTCSEKRTTRLVSCLLVLALPWLTQIVSADHGGPSHMDLSLSAPATSTGSHTVTWTNVNSSVFELQEKFNGGTYSVAYSGTATSKSFSSLPSGTYTYRIHYEFVFFGNTVHWYTDTVSTVVTSAPQPPAVPSAITGPSTNIGGLYDLSWGASSGATYYELQRQQDGGSWIVVQSTSATTRNEWAIPDGAFNYRVRACHATLCSGWTANKLVTVTISSTYDSLTTAPTENTSNLVVGSTPYALDVGTNGDAVLAVPLDLIPGVAGFEPSLSLVYESGRGVSRLERSLPEDTIGYGWRLMGLSEIRRCVVDQSSGNSIDLTNDDSLCLDGIPLVLASGTHFAVGAVYRTQIESYAKIEIKGATGALWFELTSPDGTIVEYGSSTYGARVDVNSGTDYLWSIDKETSVDGNIIDYKYYFDATRGVNYILNINYTDVDIDFEYLSRSDAAAVSIGGAPQTQSVFLHTVRVSYNDSTAREYRLLNEVVDGRRRLNKIQQCGYTNFGVFESCLAPLDFDWLTPGSTMAGVPILVDGMVDGLNAVHQIEYGTVTGSSHPFLFTERPFGNGTLPSNTQLLSGGGALRHVATKLRRDNGLGGFHDTTYAYQNKGVESTKHWGFLGFYAQRIKDEQSGIVTYAQYRMDYPYFGQVARLQQFDNTYGSHTQTLTRSESDFAHQSISHSIGTSVYPYTSARTNFIYEGSTQLGASKTSNVLTFTSGFVSQVVSTSQAGTGISTGSSGSLWGDIPTYTLSSLTNTTESTVAFTNRTTSGKWLINFPNSMTTESWPGAAIGSSIVQDATLSPQSTSLRPATVTRFPTDANLTLTVDTAYDTSGRANSVTVSGDNVSSRSTTITNFLMNRFPGQVKNAKLQPVNHGAYDVRFGTVRLKGSLNARNTSTLRDAFGRVTTVTNADSVVTTTTYTDCPTGCSTTVYGVAPSYYVQTDSVVTPIRKTYFDSLGRPIRSEVEPFSGSTYSKQDIKYDSLGRVEKVSLPYFNGTSKDVVSTYDIRNRITNVSRPDGSSIGTAYAISGSQVIVTTTDNVKNANGTSAGTQVKRNEFNILGQLTKTTDGYGTSTNPSTTYTYDANGNVLTAVVSGGTAGTTTTTFEYDAAGNQTKIIGPDIGTVATTYTGLGQVRTQTDNKGQLSTYTYDVLSRLTSLVNTDGTSTWVWDTATNGIGKLKSRSRTGFSELYAYNSDSRLSSAVNGIVPIGGSTATNYTTSHTYDTHGRPLNTAYPGGFVMTRVYNTRGYLSQLKDGVTAVHTINGLDAFGNSVNESYGNGVDTLRTFDPETGRLTDVNTTNGGTVFQNNDYAWRSNGTLESSIANPAYGLSATRKETYAYDVLNRVTLAETYINSSNTRDLTYVYNQLGNITSKTSTLAGDTDVTGYAYGAGAAGPHAVTSASIDGVSHTLTYDLNGAVTKYDIAGTSDDKYIAYNAYNQPTKIVVGSSLTDTTPVARDEFAYDPNGQRYARKSVWQDGGSTVTEQVAYVGSVEVITDNGVSGIQTITKTRLSPNVMHVKIVGTTTETFFEYAHRDHLGSIEVVTDENGNKLDNLAFEPFGMRKKKDWTANISTTELDALLDLDWDHTRKARGFTGHEHLDRTGFIHMNGRVYDPVLGRFLSPDPIVQYSTFSQSWNRYSYVNNTPTSFTDPSGFMEEIVVTGTRITTQRRDPVFDAHFDPIANESVFAHGGEGRPDPGGINACVSMTVCFVSITGTGDNEFSNVTMTAKRLSTRSVSGAASWINRAIAQVGGILATIGGAVELGVDSHVGAFSASLSGVAFRANQVENLAQLLRPLKKLAFKVGIFGAGFELASAAALATTGDWLPLAVSGGGVLIGLAAGAAFSAPVALGVGLTYGLVDLLGGFDPATYNRLFGP